MRSSYLPVISLLALCAIILITNVDHAMGIETWSPDIGDVDLDEPNRDTPYGRFRHAVALFSTGRTSDGMVQLKKLVEQHPEATWHDEAQYMIGLGYFSMGNYKKSFEKFAEFLEISENHQRRQSANILQLQCAKRMSRKNLKTCLRLFDRLIEDAPDGDFVAKCQKAKADALFSAGKYLEASQEYTNFIDTYPENELVTEAWFQIAKCHMEQAKWIDRGTQRYKQAYMYFEDFVINYPNHELTEEAKKILWKIRAVEAEKYQKIAEYYLGPANKPKAALPYLNHIRDNFPHSREAEWAENQLERLQMDRKAPLPNKFERIPLSNTTATLPDSESGK